MILELRSRHKSYKLPEPRFCKKYLKKRIQLLEFAWKNIYSSIKFISSMDGWDMQRKVKVIK